MGLNGVCHHSHSRNQQCLHLLPILNAYFGCRVCSSANRRKPRACTAVRRSSSSGGPPCTLSASFGLRKNKRGSRSMRLKLEVDEGIAGSLSENDGTRH